MKRRFSLHCHQNAGHSRITSNARKMKISRYQGLKRFKSADAQISRVVWKLRQHVLVLVSSSSLKRRSKLRGPSPIEPRVATECDDYEVDLYLRQTWYDHRLRQPNLVKPLDLNDPKLVQRIWKPEVFFANAKHAEFQYVTVPNVLVRIDPSGQILYMLRSTVSERKTRNSS
ncbi:glycine receptor subunit alpha-2 [Trichonephila clavipes]|nr:glycine receptor subunit alpha-2 [Trichonephila clavipes]